MISGTEVSNWWTNGNYQISFCRGDKGFMAMNAEQSDLDADLQVIYQFWVKKSFNISEFFIIIRCYFQTCLPPGDYCDVVSGVKQNGGCTGMTITVQQGGKAKIRIPGNADDGFVAIHAQVNRNTLHNIDRYTGIN